MDDVAGEDSGLLHILCNLDVEAGGSEDLLALCRVGALQTHHEGDLGFPLTAGVNNALGDHLTVDDTTEDVDEDALNALIG